MAVLSDVCPLIYDRHWNDDKYHQVIVHCMVLA